MKWALIIMVLVPAKFGQPSIASVPMADETVCNLAASELLIKAPKEYRVTAICVRAQ